MIVKILNSNQNLMEFIPSIISHIMHLQLTSYGSFNLLLKKSLEFEFILAESELVSFLGVYYFALKSNAFEKLGEKKSAMKSRIIQF